MLATNLWTLFGIGVVVIVLSLGTAGRIFRDFPSVILDDDVTSRQRVQIKRAIRLQNGIPDDPELRELTRRWIKQDAARGTQAVLPMVFGFVGALLLTSPLFLIPGGMRQVIITQSLLAIVFLSICVSSWNHARRCIRLARDLPEEVSDDARKSGRERIRAATDKVRTQADFAAFLVSTSQTLREESGSPRTSAEADLLSSWARDLDPVADDSREANGAARLIEADWTALAQSVARTVQLD